MKPILSVLVLSLLSVCMANEPAPSFAEPQRAVPSRISDPVPTWLVHWELARALTYAEKYDEALEHYEVLLKKRPDLSTELKSEKVTVLFWSGDHAAALNLLQELGSDADESDVVLKADLLMADKKYDEAVVVYQSVLNADPDNNEIRLRLAEVLSWQKKYPDSLALYQQVLQAHPDDNNIRRKYGMVLMWSGDHVAAIAELQKSLEKTDEE